MKQRNFIVNVTGLRIKKCCASCAYKVLEGREVVTRRCTKTGEEVEGCKLCRRWRLRKPLVTAGRFAGRVKRKEYLMFLLNVRLKEQEDVKAGREVVEKTIEEVQIEFERKYGRIYLK